MAFLNQILKALRFKSVSEEKPSLGTLNPSVLKSVLDGVCFYPLMGSNYEKIDFHIGSMFMDNDPVFFWCRANGQIQKMMCQKHIGEVGYSLSDVYGFTNARARNYKSIYEYSLSMPLNESDEDFEYTWVNTHACKIEEHVMFMLSWSGKSYVCLSDGSHRFAASYRQDLEQSRKTRFEMNTYQWHINHVEAQSVFEKWHVIMVSGATELDFAEALFELNVGMDDEYAFWRKQNNTKGCSEIDASKIVSLWLARDERSDMVVDYLHEHVSRDAWFLISDHILNLG